MDINVKIQLVTPCSPQSAQRPQSKNENGSGKGLFLCDLGEPCGKKGLLWLS